MVVELPDLDLIARVVTAVAAITGAVLGITSRFQIVRVHDLVNSRMSELLELAKSSSFAAGERENAKKAPIKKAPPKKRAPRKKKPKPPVS